MNTFDDAEKTPIETFDLYQDFTRSLAVYNMDVAVEVTAVGDDDEVYPYYHWMPYMYPALALGEEAGEVQGKIAKFIRKSQGICLESAHVERLREDVGKELGDVLYQLSETARQFGYSLQDIVDINVAKLTDRKDRGVLVGEGDSR